MGIERHVLGKTARALQTQDNVVLALHRLARFAGQALPAGMRGEACDLATTNYIGDNSFNTFVKDVNFNCSRDEALRISKKNSETIDF